jgi:elongator complex protein 3
VSVVPTDEAQAISIINAMIEMGPEEAATSFGDLVREYKKAGASMWTKHDLLGVVESSYRNDTNYPWLRRVLAKKPIRSLSGITSITVLTKPFPCPGRCVFCPVDVRMPKSYIATEPGAQRAGRLGFDPYQQVYERLRAYSELGHPTSKIEFIVLGGTWSAYEPEYQVWFIKRMFDALNDFGVSRDGNVSSYDMDWDERIGEGETYNAHIKASQYTSDRYVESATMEELRAAHKENESAASRCVGLSLETRPDEVDVDECTRLRALGATKIQIGIQSMDDTVLRLNKRGHKVKQAEAALRLLRRFGFKIQAHWMPNLYGATPDGDIADYAKVFDNLSIKPDELKVYPTALIENTELEQIAKQGKWSAYEDAELNRVLVHVMTNTPEYCRLSRVIRDIPAFEILEGNKRGNLRQIVENGIPKGEMYDIRAREIKNEIVDVADLVFDATVYETAVSTEHFLQFIRPTDRLIAGFVRLSLPSEDAPIDELSRAAIIREVHVYGQALHVGETSSVSQHQGLGRQLIAEASERARSAGFSKLAVISAVGTREYYAKGGFEPGELYQVKTL